MLEGIFLVEHSGALVHSPILTILHMIVGTHLLWYLHYILVPCCSGCGRSISSRCGRARRHSARGNYECLETVTTTHSASPNTAACFHRCGVKLHCRALHSPVYFTAVVSLATSSPDCTTGGWMLGMTRCLQCSLAPSTSVRV